MPPAPIYNARYLPRAEERETLSYFEVARWNRQLAMSGDTNREDCSQF